MIALHKTIPDGVGREGYIAALATGGKPVPVNFVANNELALHVADPAAAERFTPKYLVAWYSIARRTAYRSPTVRSSSTCFAIRPRRMTP